MPDLKKLITLEALQAALPSWLKSSSKPSYTADEISDTNTTNKFVTSADKSTWNAKGTYSKPTGGIPKSDLSQLVQDSLDLADSALQSESDPTVPSWAKQTNKPSYTQDEVTDGTTYKRVTSTEKSTWNAKGTYSKPTGGIPKSDLSQLVQNSLDLADSALQSESDPTVPSWAKQTNKPSYTQDEVTDGTTYKRVTQTEKNAWSGKQNALTTTQMSAVNSGINSTKVSQISTNQTNILYSLNTGVKNVLPIKFPDRTVYGVTLINNNDGSIRVNGTNSQSSGTILLANIQSDIYTDGYSDLSNFLGKNKDYVLVGNTTTANLRIQVLGWNSSSDNSIIASSSTDAVSFNTSTWNYIAIRLWAAASAAFSNVTITPMICTADAWAQSHDHQPPALPNSDLTRLEAEDRAALAEEIDAGAKNKIKYDMAQLAALNPLWIVSGSTIRPSSDTHITFTLNSDMSIRVQSDGSNAQAELCICTSNYSSVKAGTYVLSGCPTGGDSSTTYDLRLIEQSSPKKYNADVGLGKEITWSAQYSYTCNIMVRANQNIDLTFKPMVCTKAAWNVSNKFVPYRPDWDFVGKDAMLSIQAKAANATTFTFDISEYKGTASNRYRYGLLVGGYNASNPCLYHVFLNANNEATLTAVLPSGRTLTASTSGTALTITASDTMYGGLRLLWLD